MSIRLFCRILLIIIMLKHAIAKLQYNIMTLHSFRAVGTGGGSGRGSGGDCPFNFNGLLKIILSPPLQIPFTATA